MSRWVHNLNISHTKITNKGLKFLGNVNILKLTDNNNITDSGLRHVLNVNTLHINYCTKITDLGLKILGINGKIKKLILDGNKNITDKVIQYLGYNEYIQELDLCFCKNITDAGVKRLGNIKTLNLQGCNITNNCIDFLGNVKYKKVTF